MDEPWQIFHDELLERGQDVALQKFARDEDMAEATHEAYQAASDIFLEDLGMEAEEALGLAKSFVRVTKRWIEEGGFDFDELAERLEESQNDWEGQLA